MQEQRLFRLALEALVLNAFYDPAAGWRLVVLSHHQDEPWGDAEEAQYYNLTTAELFDVICCEAASRLKVS